MKAIFSGRYSHGLSFRNLLGIACALAFLLFGVVQVSHAAQVAEVNIDAGGVCVSPAVADDVVSMTLRVSGPQGETIFDERSDGTSICWFPSAGMPEGLFTYEVFIATGSGEVDLEDDPNGVNPTQLLSQSGTIRIEGGSLQIVPYPQPDKNAEAISGPEKATGLLASMANRLLDWLIPSAEAADLTASSSQPTIYFQDTGTGFYEWWLHTDSTYFRVRCWDGSSWTYPFYLGDNTPDNSLYIETTTGDIGLGTATPAEELHIVATYPSIRLDNGSSSRWDIEQSADDLRFYNVTDGVEAMTIEDANNYVGIGHANPYAPLHVYRNDGHAKILVQEGSTNTESTMYELINNGGVRFNFENRTANTLWSFFNRDDGQLAIGRPAVPGSEFLLSKTGNLTIKGSYYQGSSRAWKENIEPVDRRVVLDKLATLPIMSWNYKSEDSGDRHIGPMAEDFYSAFGLGRDDKHLAPQDLASVAVAASQQLYAEVQNKEERIQELESQVSELKEQMSSLQQMFNKLVLSGSFGNTVASLEGGKQAR